MRLGFNLNLDKSDARSIAIFIQAFNIKQRPPITVDQLL